MAPVTSWDTSVEIPWDSAEPPETSRRLREDLLRLPEDSAKTHCRLSRDCLEIPKWFQAYFLGSLCKVSAKSLRSKSFWRLFQGILKSLRKVPKNDYVLAASLKFNVWLIGSHRLLTFFITITYRNNHRHQKTCITELSKITQKSLTNFLSADFCTFV